jgi:hypothetical protein
MPALVEPAVTIELGDLTYLKQKRDRFEVALKDGTAFLTFRDAAENFIRAADIILTEHLPPSDKPAKEQ